VPRRPLIALATTAMLAGALGGCAGDKPPPAPLCPQVGIISGLEGFERQAADGGQLAYRAAMEHVQGGCGPEDGDLVVQIALDLIVEPGPAFAGGVTDLPYFVAISAPDGTVVDRQDFLARVTVAKRARRGGVTETFRQRFVGRAAGATQYQVLFGFTLPEDEALRQRDAG
jgi:hypothetical protein